MTTSRKWTWGASVLLLLLSLCFPTLSQEERITSSSLRTLGVDPTTFQPIVFSHNETMLAAFDQAPFEDKKAGNFYRLWFFEIGRDGKLGKAHKVPVPLATLQQGEFSPDDRSFIVLGNRGTAFHKVDLKSFALTPLFEPEWGKPGFRADPAVLWTDRQRLYVAGRPYDAQRFVETATIATLNPQATGAAVFERGPDITTLEKGLERLWVSTYLSDSAAFFGQKYPQLTLLSYWNGERVTEFDRGWKYNGFWSGNGRLLYAVRRTEGAPSVLTLYDAKNDSKTEIATSPETYTYLFLSRDGRTALFSQKSSTAGRLEVFFAQEQDGWKVHPLSADSRGQARSLATGWMRLSSNGRYVCHIGPTGLTLYQTKAGG